MEGVSIHAPREGCDVASLTAGIIYLWFQFTHPGRGATRRGDTEDHRTVRFNSRTPGGVRRKRRDGLLKTTDVSIHAPREGCDLRRSRTTKRPLSFNSRTPGGVRLKARVEIDNYRLFQFTHPGRGATSVK